MARQFCVMWQNMRCSILFHFDVPADNGRPRLSGRFRRRVVGAPTSRAAGVNHWSPAVGGDHEALHPGIELPAYLFEPEANGVDGELPGIVIDPEADIAEVGADVVDPVGDDLPSSYPRNRGC